MFSEITVRFRVQFIPAVIGYESCISIGIKLRRAVSRFEPESEYRYFEVGVILGVRRHTGGLFFMLFSDCHPIVNFLFYIGALVMGMCFVHPVFLACSFILSMSYYAVLKKGALKYMAGMSGLFIGLSVINPLFGSYGKTVLFTYFNGRIYTLEMLCYGIALAAMFVTVITWFATYNEVMTSDKFLYCFGRLAPSISLILTMVLRLVPSFQKKTEQISGARRCIGMSVENGTTYEKAEHGLTIVSALTSWALEGGVIMADSMRSRGFGSGKRTSFSVYHMKKQDKILLVTMILLIVSIMICSSQGGMEATYTPEMYIAGRGNLWTVLGVICYFLFLSIPTVLHIMEEITWHILKSRI